MGTRDTGTTHMEFNKNPGSRPDGISSRVHDGYQRKRNHEPCVSDSYEPFKGDIPQRPQGSLVAHETGEATAYGLFGAQERSAYVSSVQVLRCMRA